MKMRRVLREHADAGDFGKTPVEWGTSFTPCRTSERPHEFFGQTGGRIRTTSKAEGEDRTNNSTFHAITPAAHPAGGSPLAGGDCCVPSAPRRPCPSGLQQSIERHSAVWTGGAGWVTLRTHGFPGSRASGRPVGRSWRALSAATVPSYRKLLHRCPMAPSLRAASIPPARSSSIKRRAGRGQAA
jgi:hypothetical protein